MSDQVLKLLKDLEKKHNIKFLLAVEGGSRATGLAAPNSDFDVRCIYVHPVEWYLQVQDGPLPLDIICKSTTPDIDLKATEFRKALQLIRQSNPPLLEWLQSDVIYHQTDVIVELRKLVSKYFSKEKMAFHYCSIARTNWVEYIKGKTLVNRKKYLYILQCLLTCEYMRVNDNDLKGIPPLNFNTILKSISIPEKYQKDFQYLLNRKLKESGNWEKEERMPLIEEWILSLRETGMSYAKSLLKKNTKPQLIEFSILDKLFIDSVKGFDSLKGVCDSI